MKVSIVTVVYNAASVVERTISSVLSQSYIDYEYIVIDGKSSDGTVEIINKYKDNIDILISEKDNGVYDAMNKGIELCSGEWLVFMNAGDCFFSCDTLSNIFGNNNDYSGYDVIYGDVSCCYEDYQKYLKARSLKYLNYRMPFCHQSSFVRTKNAKAFPFDLKYKFSADYDFFHKLYIRNYQFFYIPQVLSSYFPEGGLTYSHIIEVFREESAISGKRNLRWVFHLIRAYASYYKHKLL